ncbi:MAG: guanylate kinase [Symploca sp. SIO2E6]|nr:guanylate kinase [Symploca sp. SIO2E6]
MQAGRLIVLTGPSGVGKGTLLRLLLNKHPELYLSISMTTRQPRPGEVDGKDYYFVSRDQFEQLVAAKELLEWAEYAGNYYGTPSLPVQQQIQNGHLVILEIEVFGVRQIHKTFPNVLRIFIEPPSFAALEQRIRSRGQDNSEAIAQRLQTAQGELEAADEFDVRIVNDDLEQALLDIENAIFCLDNLPV